MKFRVHSSSLLLPRVYLYIFLHFIIRSRASSLLPDLLMLNVYCEPLAFSFLFLIHFTVALPLSLFIILSFSLKWKAHTLQLFYSVKTSIRWKQATVHEESKGRIPKRSRFHVLTHGLLDCTLSFERESELVIATRNGYIKFNTQLPPYCTQTLLYLYMCALGIKFSQIPLHLTQ